MDLMLQNSFFAANFYEALWTRFVTDSAIQKLPVSSLSTQNHLKTIELNIRETLAQRFAVGRLAPLHFQDTPWLQSETADGRSRLDVWQETLNNLTVALDFASGNVSQVEEMLGRYTYNYYDAQTFLLVLFPLVMGFEDLEEPSGTSSCDTTTRTEK